MSRNRLNWLWDRAPLVASFVTLGFATQAQAATFQVTNLDSYGPGSLRQAIYDANNNPGLDEVTFDPSLNGTIELYYSLEVTDDVLITGPGAYLITLDGNDSTNIIYVTDTANTAEISGLRFLDGYYYTQNGNYGGGAAVFAYDADLTIRNCIFDSNEVQGYNSTYATGGAVYSEDGELLIQNSTFRNNYAEGNGGAVFANRNHFTLENCTFNSNSSDNDGGAVAVDEPYPSLIRNCTFYNNYANDEGGALFFDAPDGPVLIDNSYFLENSADGDGGAIYLNDMQYYGDTFTLRNSTLESNHALSGDGGGIHVEDNAVLQILNSTISHNTASEDGGGVYQLLEEDIDKCIIRNSTITGNTASEDGGGIYLYLDGGDVEITNSTISDNVASESGGGIALYQDGTIESTITITGCMISGNTAGDDGGALYFYCNGDMNGSITIVDTALIDNTADDDGGAINIEISESLDGNLTLRNCLFMNNTATNADGGALELECVESNGTILIENCTFSGNSAEDGGAVYFYADDGFYGGINIRDCTFDLNTASNEGGALSIYDDESDYAFRIENCTFSNNTAQGDGGAIWFYADDSFLTMFNCTICGNTSATGDGGAIYIQEQDESFWIVNCTLTGNTAPAGTGGAVFLYTGNSYFYSNIVFDNTALNGNDLGDGTFYMRNCLLGDPNITGAITDMGNNIYYDNPLLGPLQDNGGPTLTKALLTGSPCIDTGFNNAFAFYDQRGPGYPRIQGLSTDMGAFETISVVSDVLDSDNDGIPNDQDPDDDNDGIKDKADPDRDGDGVDNIIDPDPDNPLITGAANIGGRIPLSIKKVAAKLDFLTVARDTVKLQGVLPVSANFDPLNVVIELNVGGQTFDFILDGKGRDIDGGNKFSLKASKKPTANGTFPAKFTMTAKKGDFDINDINNMAFDGTPPVKKENRVVLITMRVTNATIPTTGRGAAKAVQYKAKETKGSFKSRKK